MADRLDLETEISRAFLNAHVVNMLVDRLLTDRGHLAPGAALLIRPEDADALIHMAGDAADAARVARERFLEIAHEGSV